VWRLIRNEKNVLYEITAVEMMARVSMSDNLYLIQTESNPKQYSPIMGGTAIYIGQKRIRGNKWAE
jgi:hypothetical protein